MTDHEQNPVRHVTGGLHEAFVFHYEITLEDFQAKVGLLGTLAPYYRRGLMIFWFAVVVNILISVGLLIDASIHGDEINPWYFVNFGLAVIFLLLRYVTRPNLIKHTYRNSSFGGREYESHLSVDNIRIVSPGIETTIQWSFVKGAVETENYLYLIYSNVDALTIPVRAFENEKQKQACLKFIRNKVGNYPMGQNTNSSKNSSPPELFD